MGHAAFFVVARFDLQRFVELRPQRLKLLLPRTGRRQLQRRCQLQQPGAVPLVHQAVLLYQNHKAQLMELAEPLTLPPPDEKEQQFQELWRQFYKTLEIKARHNEKGRMTHCPKRFWADMTEMKEELK